MNLIANFMIAVLLAILVFSSEHKEISTTNQVSSAKFKYLIFGNKVDEKKDIQYSRRILNVLLEEREFSEHNLKTLHSLLSKRFPEPQWLEVWVYTNLSQTENPEEADLPKSSNAPDNSELHRFHWAWIYSKKGNVLFRYNISPPARELRTVIISGKDPYSVSK